MGTNYYLTRKIKYIPEENTPFSLGCDCGETNPFKINNGWIVKNTYYKTIEDFSSSYEQEVHIGKASMGWHFSLAIYPKYGINNFKDWEKLILDPDNIIKDECDRVITPQEMIDIITKRKGFEWKDGMTDTDIAAYEKEYVKRLNDSPIFGYQYPNYDAFLGENSAERGNYLLLKHSPSSDKFVRLAEDPMATYDYIISGNDPDEGVIFS